MTLYDGARVVFLVSCALSCLLLGWRAVGWSGWLPWWQRGSMWSITFTFGGLAWSSWQSTQAGHATGRIVLPAVFAASLAVCLIRGAFSSGGMQVPPTYPKTGTRE